MVASARVIIIIAPVAADNPPINAKMVNAGELNRIGTPKVKYCGSRGTASSEPAHKIGNMGSAINSKNRGKAQVTVRELRIRGFSAKPKWKMCGMVTAVATNTKS